MKEIEIQAKNIDEAISIGLKRLGTTKENVDIHVLDEGKTGLFGLMGSSPATVRLTVKDERLVDENAPDYSKIIKDVEKMLLQLIALMGLNVAPKTTLLGGRILVQITGEDSSILIGKSGTTLTALETIINLMIGKQTKTKVKIKLDIDNYREKKTEKLKALAESIATDVIKDGKQKKLYPMPAFERRIIHVTLERNKEVETISKGEGANRYILVVPKTAKEND